ncbi:MAG: type I-E CRISPR-associated protein Cse1/CasA [Thermodesulfobacteriota bacterium]
MEWNLLRDRWIPVRLAGGGAARVGPWEVCLPEVLAVDPPRPDFAGALLEFLIGLLATAAMPADDEEWEDWLDRPPGPDDLKKRLAPLEPFFNVLGDRPCFMQDLTLVPGPAKDHLPVAGLFIESPGDKTLSDNTDFFIKRGKVQRLCPHCAALALHTLQTYSPSGGRGHRTSLRGGGPLTTLLTGRNLWRTIWKNVLPAEVRGMRPAPGPDGLAGVVFPWAAPTRTSEPGSHTGQTLPQDVHPLHMFWGMPRRILLLPETLERETACDLCAVRTRTVVERYAARPFGTNYEGPWEHPLTPYRSQGPEEPALSLKGRSDGARYKHWLGLTCGDPGDAGRPVRPALCVAQYRRVRWSGDGADQRILAFGFDMDNAKARQWSEGEYPLVPVRKEHEETLAREAEKWIGAADQARRSLVGGLKEAVFRDAAQATVDKTLLENAAVRFWSATEEPFYGLMRRLAGLLRESADSGLEPRMELRREWVATLRRSAEDLFHQEVESGSFLADQAPRVYRALNRMRAYLVGGCNKILEI